MPSFRYLQLDVFPATPGGGNPLGVVFGASYMSSAQMQRLARWLNLVETTFVLPAETADADYRLGIFTPSAEIPFAGHPTIGSAHSVLDSGFATARNGQLIQQCGAGLLPIRVNGAGATRELFVRAPGACVVREGSDDASLRAALGFQALGRLAPALVDGGRRWWIAEFADEAAVRTWQPNHAAIKALARADACMGLCVFGRCANPDHDLVVRAFPAGAGIVEDPASGAANGLIAAYIAEREPDGKLARGYRVSQGREMGHDAALAVRIEADGAVWVGGRTRTVIDGTLAWP
ncbi:MAG: PhzF family phenazine biosynthesis protein [Xanthomonadaceae bacterium]|nr:PhzF family phenazine biosynthesis protein [Xanthomonadaceae bacterium]